ncbi:MAG: hypothetical protein ACKVQV_14910 [Bacteroidia bacterium]
MKQGIEITLNGTTDEFKQLFSYTSVEEDAKLATLEDYMAHVFNQSMDRDRFHGSWAEVINDKDKGTYVLKMFSPHHDLSPYCKLIPAYLEAGKVALSIFQMNQKLIPPASKDQMRFLLPFGLSMANCKSVQLLHFPPLETFVYQDYLYSPTNRRWENLLGYNNLTISNFSELETIVDCVPIAAPGGDSTGIAPFNNLFTAYVKQMLQARLNPNGKITQPVMAYGGPVMDWLKLAFADQIDPQIKGPLAPLSLVELKLFDSDVITPVLCANHPSKYLYYTDDNKKADAEVKKEIMTQDLIAAGWQYKMANEHHHSPKTVLDEMKKHWTNNKRVLEIIEQEDQSYGYKI